MCCHSLAPHKFYLSYIALSHICVCASYFTFLSQSFKTIDPSIYAVSDYTRFSRVYRNAVPHKR